MCELKFIYFKGCPNISKVRSMLQELGESFEEVFQDDLPDNHPLKSYSSPTLLKGDKIIFGAKTSSGGGCSLGIPLTDELREKLK